MAFREEYIDITQFRPDPATFDVERDLIRVNFEDVRQKLYVSLLGEWGIRHADPTIPDVFRRLLDRPAFMFQEPEGIRVDRAIVGEKALFSVLGRNDHSLWRSRSLVAGLTPVRRTTRLRSVFELDSSR